MTTGGMINVIRRQVRWQMQSKARQCLARASSLVTCSQTFASHYLELAMFGGIFKCHFWENFTSQIMSGSVKLPLHKLETKQRKVETGSGYIAICKTSTCNQGEGQDIIASYY